MKIICFVINNCVFRISYITMLGSAKAAPEAGESLLEHFAQVGK